jgi:hypothetical protein
LILNEFLTSVCSIFDMISAVGGTLGLFTGISVITLVSIL